MRASLDTPLRREPSFASVTKLLPFGGQDLMDSSDVLESMHSLRTPAVSETVVGVERLLLEIANLLATKLNPESLFETIAEFLVDCSKSTGRAWRSTILSAISLKLLRWLCSKEAR